LGLVRLQELQSAVQAELQHTPCAQKPELQEAPVVQAAPIDSRPQLEVAVLQVFGEAQSAVDAQVFLQTPFAASHANGAQSDEVTAWQLPAPSQVRAGV
jgi:hypothetical protein